MDEESLWKNTKEQFISYRNEWSEKIGSTGQRLDNFFSGRGSEIETNHSFMRVGLETQFAEQGNTKLSPLFRFRLHLPALQKRLRIVVESESEEQKSLTENTLDPTLVDEKFDTNTVTGALQFFKHYTEGWDLSTSIGLKVKAPIDPFWRAKAHRTWDITDPWQLKLNQSIYYFKSNGWGAKSRFTFSREVGENHYASISSEIKWLHNERKFEFGQLFQWKQEIDTVRAMRYQFGLLGTNRPRPMVDHYYLNTTYRRKLYQDWLFYEMIPELLFPEDKNYSAEPSFTIRLEVILASD